MWWGDVAEVGVKPYVSGLNQVCVQEVHVRVQVCATGVHRVCDHLRGEGVRVCQLLGQVCDDGKSPSFGAMWTQVGVQPTPHRLCV